MADMQFTHDMGHVGYAAPETTSTPPSNPLKNLTNFAGAAVSLALIAGVSVWGYKLVMRDVSGIPVVRAADGDMRVRPADPGGQLAINTGLAVNEVAAAGEASGPVDRLVLAPKPMDLMDEDQPMEVQSVAPVQQPTSLDVAASLEAAPADAPAPVNVAEALTSGSVEDLVNQLTAGVTPIEAETAEVEPVLASVAVPDVPAREPTAKITGPGPKQSKRPQLRPKSAPAVVVPTSAAPTPQVAADLDAAAIPAGTRLVQLGAIDSPEIARAQWD
ncbi:MAG: SPOR domain-containing protein, partial [Pseudomonadota bacterium]